MKKPTIRLLLFSAVSLIMIVALMAVSRAADDAKTSASETQAILPDCEPAPAARPASSSIIFESMSGHLLSIGF